MDKSQLFFNDLRQFGFLQIVTSTQLAEITAKFGVEPLDNDFSYEKFNKIIEKHLEKNIKSFLLDQSLIAGIGNIYADEILFVTQVSPHNKVKNLTKKKRHKMFVAIKDILKKAIKYRGTTFNNFVDTKGQKGSFLQFLKVYSRGGQPCLECENILRKEKIAGRGTVWCERCQKKK